MSTAVEIVQKYFPEVTSVQDAKEGILIEVTPKDNKSALVRNHKACAMAVACKKKTQADGVIVSISKAYVVIGKTAYRYEVSEHAQREIISFDRNAGFAPGEYQLNAPGPRSRLGVNHIQAFHRDLKAKKIVHRKTDGIRTVVGSGLS